MISPRPEWLDERKRWRESFWRQVRILTHPAQQEVPVSLNRDRNAHRATQC